MKRALLMTALILCLAGLTDQVQAQTDTISVTVSMETIVSVTVTPDTWNLGAIATSTVYGPQACTATNNGNVRQDLTITGSDGLGGWILGATPGTDTFAVDVDGSPLSTTPLSLTSGLPASSSYPFNLSYSSPTADTQGGGANHNFTITITASQTP